MEILHKSPVLMAILSALLFGAATPASKRLLEDLEPFQLAGFLYLGAAAVVLPSALKNGRFALPGRSDRKNQFRLLGAVIFGGILGPVALLLGLRMAQAASVSLWLNLELAATAVIGVFLFKDHLGSKGWIGVGVVLTSSTVLAWGPEAAGIIPGVLVFCGCLCWGLDNHLTALIDGIKPSQSTLWKGIVAGTVNLIIGLTFSPLSAGVIICISALLVGAFSYGVSIVLYIRSAQTIGATRAQVLFASAPFFGVALSFTALGENISVIHVFAIPLFLIGVGFLLMESHSHYHVHEAMSHEHAHNHHDDHHNHIHPELSPKTVHTHQHEHDPVTHRHPHWPDLHHRHHHHD